MNAERGDSPRATQAAIAPWPHALLILSFFGLAAASALSRSAAPVVLGRYSASAFGYQLFNLAALALLSAPARGGRSLGALLAAGSTFLAPLNEAVRHLPGLLLALPAIRLLAGLALVAHEFDRFRAGRKPVRGVLIGLGASLVVLSMSDLALWAVVRTRPDFGEDHAGFRDPYDMTKVTSDDVLLVGDSFVWGHGVARDRRFGDVLERLYAREGRPVRVFSLGVRGAGPDQYVDSLARVPEGREAGAVVFAFYPNDLAPRPRPHSRAFRRAQDVTWTLGRSSLSVRALHDLLGKLETPTVAHYHRSVIADYRRDDPTFRARWAALVDALDRFARLSRQHTPAPPVLLLIPLMVDFHDYPLGAAHEDLGAAARGLGYEVLDLLPPLREALGDGGRYRVAAHDNHFDARVHERVAALVKQRLDALPATARLGRSR